MSNNYTQFSSIINSLTAEEAAWWREFLRPAEDEELEGGKALIKWLRARKIPAYYDDEPEFWPHFEYELKETPDEKFLWFHSSETGNIDIIAHAVKHFLKTFRPNQFFSLQWADICSSLRADEFGGGAIFVTAKSVSWMISNDWIYKKQLAFQKRQESQGA